MSSPTRCGTVSSGYSLDSHTRGLSFAPVCWGGPLFHSCGSSSLVSPHSDSYGSPPRDPLEVSWPGAFHSLTFIAPVLRFTQHYSEVSSWDPPLPLLVGLGILLGVRVASFGREQLGLIDHQQGSAGVAAHSMLGAVGNPVRGDDAVLTGMLSQAIHPFTHLTGAPWDAVLRGQDQRGI